MKNASITNTSLGFVIRTKNRNLLLNRALHSISAQTYPQCKVVIVNDGGDPEGVEQICKPFKPGLGDRLRCIHNPTSVGMEAASNLGVQQLDTTLICIHDDDDSVSPEYASRMVAAYEQHKAHFPNIRGVACHCNRVVEHVEGNVISIDKHEVFNQHLHEGIMPLDLMLIQNQFPPICFVFERSAHEELGGFDESLPVLGDWDYHLRFLTEHDIWIVSETLAFYHHRPNADASLGNSVVSGADKHRLYRVVLENKWLRRDLKQGTFSLGSHVALSKHSAHTLNPNATSGRSLAKRLVIKLYRRFLS